MVARKGENCGRKEGGELWWQGRGRTKGENYGGKSSQVKFLFVYRPVALYKEGGELWWQGRGRTKGGITLVLLTSRGMVAGV